MAAHRRIPPKSRTTTGRRTGRPAGGREHQPPPDDTRGYSAPSHMGGQFEEAGYGHGHGMFGFTQHQLP